MFVLEERQHAERRGATIQARILADASRFEPGGPNRPPRGDAIRQSISAVLAAAGLQPADIGHVNANGLGTIEHDRAEAQAIRDVLADVPVTAPKSYFGNLGAAGGAVEMVASLLAMANGRIPPTLNYEHPDPQCPVNVVHGAPLGSDKPIAVLLNQAVGGQAVALALEGVRIGARG